MKQETVKKSKSKRNDLLDDLAYITFQYFMHEVNPVNGLVKDKTASQWPASIAAVGLALTAYPVGVEHGWLSRSEAIKITLATLRFFWHSDQSTRPDATGYKGFYYHFLDIKDGRRAWNCELSTIDSLFLLAGALTAGIYFYHNTGEEREIRELAENLYRRADWQWALNGGDRLAHGWSPENGFIKYRWEGYDEALLLYILALGSPTFPLPPESYAAWTSTYAWKKIYELEFLYAGPLFIHQLSHIWIDLRKIQDKPMREKGLDYFENSRRSTLAQNRYAINNPLGFTGYGERCWGITASDGPGPMNQKLDGIERQFFDYMARGAPYGPDDGTIAPWAVVASVPFAPQVVLPTIEYFNHLELQLDNPYGFKATFNMTYPGAPGRKYGWVSKFHFGINQGPIVLMIENYRSDMLWEMWRRNPYLLEGLRKADFTGGWLG